MKVREWRGLHQLFKEPTEAFLNDSDISLQQRRVAHLLPMTRFSLKCEATGAMMARVHRASATGMAAVALVSQLDRVRRDRALVPRDARVFTYVSPTARPRARVQIWCICRGKAARFARTAIDDTIQRL